jgi:glycine amidinotransferase
MTYSVYQHWDPLEVCLVGKSYSPEFYTYIENPKIREVFERIAKETEEDYQKLITLLESFGVEIIRPDVSDNYLDYLNSAGKIVPPPMTPRDYSIMLGEEFYFKSISQEGWDILKGVDWPAMMPTSVDEFDSLPRNIKNELEQFKTGNFNSDNNWKTLDNKMSATGTAVITYVESVHLTNINSAQYTRIGRDVYVGTEYYGQDTTKKIAWLNKNKPEYRWHSVDSGGHSDGTFCPVKPGLIISLHDIPTYTETFPGWEVVYLPGQSWKEVKPFLDLKEKNKGKWWVPGEELNDDFTDYVEEWMDHWVGYVEETVFDVNMLVIDEQNVVCNNYNKDVFDAFERHGITPHIVNFRHRYFWDGGLHCITSDISRRGTMQDYFPERG